MVRKLKSPLEPMEALSVDEIPTGSEWQYEPKWDGFRCLAFRDGDKVELQSKSGQPLARYFPKWSRRCCALKAKQFVLDGEIVDTNRGRLSFDELLMRIHPAASRVKKLAAEHPATYIVFDLLANERGKSLLEKSAETAASAGEVRGPLFCRTRAVRLSPATKRSGAAQKMVRCGGRESRRNHRQARSTCRIAPASATACKKSSGGGRRIAWSADFATPKAQRVIGSLLLGLYDDEGLLHHVGFTSSFKAADRQKITKMVEPLIRPPGFTGQRRAGRAAGARSGARSGSR